jgi:hypothetical protein
LIESILFKLIAELAGWRPVYGHTARPALWALKKPRVSTTGGKNEFNI